MRVVSIAGGLIFLLVGFAVGLGGIGIALLAVGAGGSITDFYRRIA